MTHAETLPDPAPIPPDADPARWALMARALAWLAERREENPSLDALAAHLGLSPHHFQREFSRWVGVSPKRYVQYLTLDLARRLLAERFTVLDAAHEAGLSGPGRLHDLFVRWEAMTPGDYARRGEGLEIAWGWFDSPFGPTLAMGTDRGLCGLAFAAETGAEAAMADLRGRWPAAAFIEAPERLASWVAADQGVGGAAGDPLGPRDHLRRDRARHRRPPRGARRRHGGRAQPDQLPDPLPPGHPDRRGPRRLSLGPAGQARDPGVGERAARRGRRLNGLSARGPRP
jgi:AraC-like DNA-binding protein